MARLWRSDWGAWVGANALGELLGLGFVFASGFASIHLWGEPRSAPGLLLLGGFAIVLGALEGVVVGECQWRVLRRILPSIPRRRWVQATVAGAVLAWLLGMIPSTVGSLVGETTETPTTEPALAMVMGLAAAMGLVAGLILAWPQARVLRQETPRARLWLPANAVAWALGMPWIFFLVGATVGEGLTAQSVALFLAGLAVAGALVGAVHGWVLVRWVAPTS